MEVWELKGKGGGASPVRELKFWAFRVGDDTGEFPQGEAPGSSSWIVEL